MNKNDYDKPFPVTCSYKRLETVEMNMNELLIRFHNEPNGNLYDGLHEIETEAKQLPDILLPYMVKEAEAD